MTENLEKRKSVRIDHTSPLKIEDRKSGKLYKARMLNYSKTGLYFESDSILQSGDQIYIGIEDSPYASYSGVFEYYRSEIKWRKKLKDSYFDYGYGVEIYAELNKKSSKNANIINRKTEAGNAGKPIRQALKITDHSRSYEGIIKDISTSGVFFTTEDTFEEGQVLTFCIALKNGQEAQIDGQIVWGDHEGFGVIFLDKKEFQA